MGWRLGTDNRIVVLLVIDRTKGMEAAPRPAVLLTLELGVPARGARPGCVEKQVNIFGDRE